MYPRGRVTTPYVYVGASSLGTDTYAWYNRSTAGTSAYDYIGEERRGTSIVVPMGEGGPVPERSLSRSTESRLGKDDDDGGDADASQLRHGGGDADTEGASFPAYNKGTA